MKHFRCLFISHSTFVHYNELTRLEYFIHSSISVDIARWCHCIFNAISVPNALFGHPSKKVATILNDANTSTINIRYLMFAEIREMKKILPVLPDAFSKRNPPFLLVIVPVIPSNAMSCSGTNFV